MKEQKYIQQMLVVLVALAVCADRAGAQGSAFTYQGRLSSGTNVATGVYDLKFTLFDSSGGAGVSGGPVTNAAAGVTNGLFTANLDFGAGAFGGAARWLEIGVRTNGGGAFATLTPRQKITAAPYAITASNLTGVLPAAQLVGTLSSGQLAGAYSGAVTFSNAANTFAGSGAGLTGVNAVTFGGYSVCALPCYWNLGGNAGTTAGVNFLGTTDSQPLELKVNGQRALRLESMGANLVNVIGGSSADQASGSGGVTIGGGNTNLIYDSDYATIGGGLQNSVNTGSPYGVVAGGLNNVVYDVAANIGGGERNRIDGGSHGTIGGGGFNRVGNYPLGSGVYATIAGGVSNFVGGGYASAIGGGSSNHIDGGAGMESSALGATIAGGNNNWLHGKYSTIGGGNLNAVNATNSTIAGGSQNIISSASQYAGGSGSSIGGGIGNSIQNGVGGQFGAEGSLNTISGGGSNQIFSLEGAFWDTISGGSGNQIWGSEACAVGGGHANTISADNNASTIGGGDGNYVDGSFSTIAGGRGNAVNGDSEISSVAHFIGGGDGNYIGVPPGNGSSVISGGQGNRLSAGYSFVGGGFSNNITGGYSGIAGGASNSAGGNWSAIGGGQANQAVGAYTTIPGGTQAKASNYGQMAHASGQFAAAGDAQSSAYVCRRTTTNATVLELFLDGNAEYMVVPVNTTWTFDILVTGRAANGNSASYQIRGAIKNNAGTTTLVGSPTTTVIAKDDATWGDAVATAGDVHDALIVDVTGKANTTIRWVANVRTAEVGF